MPQQPQFSEHEKGQKTADKFEVLPNELQQNKIVAVLDSGDLELLDSKEAQVDSGDRDLLLKKIAYGEIPQEKFRELIENRKLPVSYENANAVEDLFNRIESDKQMRAIVAEFSYIKSSNRDLVKKPDLVRFLRGHQDPSLFEPLAQKFLVQIEALNGTKKRKEYEEKMRALTSMVFGERQEYWDQIKLLKQEALQRFPQTR